MRARASLCKENQAAYQQTIGAESIEGAKEVFDAIQNPKNFMKCRSMRT